MLELYWGGTSSFALNGRRVAVALLLSGFLILGLVATASQASAADWPSYRGGPTQNMSRAEDPGTGPQQIWESVTSVRNEPCVIAAGDSVFTIASPAADFGAQRVFRIEAASGKVVWSSPTFEADVSTSCPTVDGTRVVYSHGTHLTALEVSDGTQAWDIDLGGSVGIPVATEGTVYVNANQGKAGTLFARDISSGEALWSAEAPITQKAPIVLPSAVVSLLPLPKGGGALNAYDRADGKAAWSIEGAIGEAIGVGSTLFYSTGSAVLALNASDGSLLWSHEAPKFTAIRKLVAGNSTVYALTPSTDFLFQVNHLLALDIETGKVVYSREFEKVESCCGTTAAYPPFVRFGTNLYNQYRFFDAKSGQAPGAENARTHTLFYDGKGCANEQDSMFAHVGLTVYAWKNNCSTSALVARRDALSPESFGLIKPPFGFVLSEPRPTLAWKQNGDNPGGTGIDHYEVEIDGKTLADDLPAVTGTFTPGFDLSSGTHTWSVTAVDRAGNSRFGEKSLFTIDLAPPSAFSLLAPAEEAVVGPRPQFTWSPAEDDSGISHYLLTVDGEEFGETFPGEENFIPPFDITAGPHTWFVTAFDNAGHSRNTKSRIFTVDSTPPSSFKLIAPAHDAVTGPRPDFSWQPASDPEGSDLDHYELIVDGKVRAETPAGVESFSPSFDFSQGGHDWTVAAVDSLGNRTFAEVRKFFVDALAPVVELIAPEQEAFTGARPQFSWHATFDEGEAGLDHYELTVDKETLAEIPADAKTEIVSFTPSSDLAPGFHAWWVTTVDKVGNRRQSEVRVFSVDTSPPNPFALITPPDKALTSARPQFGWEAASDAGSAGIDRYELAIDGETVAAKLPPGEESFTPEEDLIPGSHTWSVTAFDRAGNQRQSETRTFTVDGSPPEPFGLLKPADKAVTGVQPQFSWEAALDSGTGLDRYELFVDGEVLTKTPAGVESFTPEVELTPGGHTWHVIAVDNVGNERSSESRSFIVASPPIAVLAEPSVLTLTGTPVTFDASASVPPAAGAITNYEWDLNGDGSFERDTGETSTTTRIYNNVKDLTVTLRVKSNLGTEATTSAQVSVRLAPPPGHLGVTINEGEEFTNSRKVTISPVWPAFALTALVSNDGGFKAASTFPVAASITWKLDSAGAERLPKTIYVRFQGGEAGRETYQDDIILDLTKPKVAAASFSDSGELLRVRARDSVSGIAAMQISSEKAGARAWKPFRSKVRWAGRRGRSFVRVRDRAGNVSVWRRIALD